MMVIETNNLTKSYGKISLGLVQALFLLGMYPIFMDSKVNMTEVLNNFPEPFMKAFSFQIDSFYQFESFCFL